MLICICKCIKKVNTLYIHNIMYEIGNVKMIIFSKILKKTKY